ncbi:hypothetical protein EMIHUDRAFT_416204 [Emiliania huxleyi CCMP1516]|uniref:Glutamine--fructose-6-phosphate aminotransferase [isomerizing] n=2 Tax=Emiliania huxleyi TaxID=2903 RepID=A0A0D3IWK7_EMIH1|nr:hypothetical protein EMIHUDRAFT_416204 [Emiliania huxleyi CCMP1516]EOD15642.1 hypothetical protein EMIHUDRAFT_416204 [Emiliania huxleyi CCMP1516]|eukprot:XP_005768071.1 hypothetical protein EMIHUDRAFT_416204 [Emiliania huxleyi CCMP1516]
MCGIVAYLGPSTAKDVMLAGLARLEYRGYDSAGVASGPSHTIGVVKAAGKVSVLASRSSSSLNTGTVGIAHTRWATHGAPTDANAHPHTSSDGGLAIVHNGIVENFVALREELQRKGYRMASETDTELIAHLISDVRKQKWMPLEEAVRQALSQVQGAYGICVISSEEPDLLARKGSPLLLGIGEDEYLLASDASAVIERTRRATPPQRRGEGSRKQPTAADRITMIDDGSLSRLRPEVLLSAISRLISAASRLQEICEQPEVLENAMRGRVTNRHSAGSRGCREMAERWPRAPRIIVVACGTSHHAGLIGEYLLENLARCSRDVEYASEFRYRNPILCREDVLIAISQSGETADTRSRRRRSGKSARRLCLGICNTVGSSIARETDGGVYLHAGPEIGVASTKALSAPALVALTLIALKLGKERETLSPEELSANLGATARRCVLEQKGTVYEMAKVFKYASNFLFLGRGYHYPLKEISYIHAEGYPAAEMKHGPIALIDQFMPVVIIAPTSDPNYRKLVSNIEEASAHGGGGAVRARGGSVIAITEEDNHELDAQCEYVMRVPSTADFLMPLLCVAPLQLMAYYIADMRQCNVDQPRNLAKSVTVE